LLDLYPERVRERSQVEWNRTAERVEAVEELLYGEVALETRQVEPEPQAAAALLAEKALEAGLERFADADDLNAFRDAGHRPRTSAAGGSPAGAQSTARPDYHRSGRLLAAFVPAGTQGAGQTLSQARVAGKSVGGSEKLKWNGRPWCPRKNNLTY
jgi:hypothetical protein